MGHKRKRPKNRRSGCLMCKYWKINGFGKRHRKDGERFSDHKRRQFAQADIDSAFSIDEEYDPASIFDECF